MNPTKLNKNILIPVLCITLALVYFIFGHGKSTQNSATSTRIADPWIKISKQKVVKKMSDKISPDGHYLPFYGYTIVSMLTDRYELNQIYDSIKNTKFLSKFLTPLPISSYHVTIYDIFTQRKIPLKYTSDLASSMKLSQNSGALKTDLLAAQYICDKIQGGITFKPKNIVFGDGPGRPFIVEGEISNLKELNSARDMFTSLFDKDDSARIYHMTLGYVHSVVTDHDKAVIMKELQELWQLLQREYSLDRPNVCYFESMREFQPIKMLLNNTSPAGL
ncbi:uncharacterized protein LOC131934547 [Physella acuta]|uniref:uncharacterized protein LOC131934547 n=1 Tax=Physella acuta TaxID=109671 RepID=UPI0027DCE213|nr:uncharacterized protein LOC131934547 [Physella acuta]XP_059146572.1 uncharacterized protein LOC131934547 [Physella acuta]